MEDQVKSCGVWTLVQEIGRGAYGVVYRAAESLSGSDISGGAGVVWLPCEDSGWLGVTLSGGEPLFFWEWTRGRKRAWKH